MWKNIAWDWLFGFFLLIDLSVLAALMALGKVEEKTSFGLREILIGLVLFAQQWSSYMFSKGQKPKEIEPPQMPKIEPPQLPEQEAK
jgi:hypothetical protein